MRRLREARRSAQPLDDLSPVAPSGPGLRGAKGRLRRKIFTQPAIGWKKKFKKESAMKTPGFTADVSLITANECYAASRHGMDSLRVRREVYPVMEIIEVHGCPPRLPANR